MLLAAYDTKPPTAFNPESALRRPVVRTPAPVAATPAPRPHPPGTITGKGPLITTPFSSIQVQAWVHRGKLIDVKTLYLTGSDAHTNALNARAEPILRREALAAGKAEVDAVDRRDVHERGLGGLADRGDGGGQCRLSTSWGCR